MNAPTSKPPITTSTSTSTGSNLVRRFWRFEAYWTKARYELLASFRQLDFSIPTLLFPAIFYLFFGVLFGGGGYSEYLVVAYATFGIIGTALFGFGVGVAVARESGQTRLEQVSPMPTGAFIIANITASFVFSCIILIEFFLINTFLGEAHYERVEWLALAGVLLLGTIPFGAFGLAIGIHASGQGAPALINLIFLPMSFLSGLWVPIMMMPDFLQKVAFVLPPFHLAQLALGIVGSDVGCPWQIHVAVLLAFTLACLGIASRGQRG